MAVRASAMLNTVAEELQIPEEELLREGLPCVPSWNANSVAS